MLYLDGEDSPFSNAFKHKCSFCGVEGDIKEISTTDGMLNVLRGEEGKGTYYTCSNCFKTLEIKEPDKWWEE